MESGEGDAGVSRTVSERQGTLTAREADGGPRDGSIDAFADGSRFGSAMRVRHQQDADAGWSPVRSMGKVPDPYVNLGRPGVVEQLPDGRLHVVAQERNRARLWEIYQSEPGGGWGPWQRWPEGAAPKPLGIVTTPLRFRPDGRPEAPAFTSIDNRTIDNRTINCRPQGACELVVFGTRVHGPELLRHPLGFGDQG